LKDEEIIHKSKKKDFLKEEIASPKKLNVRKSSSIVGS
jgi:hypothetical protein